MSTAVLQAPTYSRFDDIPQSLRTRTAWRDIGRRVRKDAIARAFYDSYWYNRAYGLYVEEDTEPLTRRVVREGTAVSFSAEFVVTSIQTINDAAKRRRDAATRAYRCGQHGRARICSDEKAEFYELKDRVLKRLLALGRAHVVAHHSKIDHWEPAKPYLGAKWPDNEFDRYAVDGVDVYFDGETEWELEREPLADDRELATRPVGPQTTILEVVEFAGHRFHVPVDAPPDAVTIQAHLGDRLSPARPLGRVRLRDAIATLRTYLNQPLIVLPAVVTSVVSNVTSGQIIQAIGIPWLAIIGELNRNPRFLFEFVNHPRNFEEFIAASYHRAGFEVVLTPRSADLGRDVIATRPGHLSVRVLDQCKAYSAGHTVSANDVRAMLGVITGDQNTSKGIITTTASFAPGVEHDSLLSPFFPHRLELRDGIRLREWLATLADPSQLNF